MVKVIDTLSGSPCYRCGDPIEGGWVLTEVREDDWQVICIKCDLIAESEGK